MPKHLFVGGPADGKWIDVPSVRDKVRIRHASEPTMFFDRSKPIESTEYSRRRMVTDNHITELFAPVSLIDVNVFRLLVNNYNPPKEKE